MWSLTSYQQRMRYYRDEMKSQIEKRGGELVEVLGEHGGEDGDEHLAVRIDKHLGEESSHHSIS